jgi:hypothetical protein
VSGNLVFNYLPTKILTLQTGLRAYSQLLPSSAFEAQVPPAAARPQWAAFLAAQVQGDILEM